MVGSEWSPFPDEKDEESQEGRTQGHLVILRQRTRVFYPDAGFSGGGHGCCLPLHLAWGRCLLGQSQRWQGVSSSRAWKEGSSLPSPRPPHTEECWQSAASPPERPSAGSNPTLPRSVFVPSWFSASPPVPWGEQALFCLPSVAWDGSGEAYASKNPIA